MSCGTNTDFMFPLEADIFYPIVMQGGFGAVQKTWVKDRTVGCNFSSAGSASKEDVKPNVNITNEVILIGRVRGDIRVSTLDSNNAITNIIITNIRDKNCNPVYVETSGPRAGKSTIFEIASNEPFVGPFGSIEHFNLVIRRSENQGADV
jgi:hypothetical protein